MRTAAVLFIAAVGCASHPARLAPVERSAPLGDVARVHLIDVGQGAATLFELPCGAVLVDTGGETDESFDSGHALLSYLESFFARRADLRRTIDLLVLTHPHLDHTRNAPAVVERFAVRNVISDGRRGGSGGQQQRWLEDWARRHARYEAIRAEEIAPGGASDSIVDPLQCEVDPAIAVLWGGVSEKPPDWSDEAFANDNNHSILLRIDFGRASFLVSGDLELPGIAAVLAKHRASGRLDVDLWQVGHHGSYNATSKEWLDAVTPRMALVPVGPADREGDWTAWEFGLPRKKAIDLLVAAIDRPRPLALVRVGTAMRTFEPYRLEKAIYATGWDGTVVVAATAGGELRVERAAGRDEPNVGPYLPPAKY